jgi:acyl carrier protein
MTEINVTDRATILVAMRDIIEEVAGPRKNPITAEATFDADLDLDSLTMVEIIVLAEEKFDVRIPDSAFGDLTTVGDAVDFIADKTSQASA